jgi:predicted nucleic acid-binding protein
MIVVADSSPLHYLILLEQAEILRQLYGNVLIPDTVAAELRAAASPRKVSEWVSSPPSWLRIVEVTAEQIVTVADELDLGERAAIALAETTGADLLLIDESAGRAEARRRSLRVTGTLGVLRAGAEAGLLDARDVVLRLQATNFYVDEALLRTVFSKWLEEAG